MEYLNEKKLETPNNYDYDETQYGLKNSVKPIIKTCISTCFKYWKKRANDHFQPVPG